jgi:hypothetical protein
MSVWDSVAQGRDLVRDSRENQLMRQAGGAFASGDYTGAGNMLARGGDIGSAMKVQAYGQDQAQAPERAQMEKAKQTLGLFREMAQGLARLPVEQRAQAAQQYVARLQQFGIPTDQLGPIDPNEFTDQGLAMFVGELDKAEQQFTLAPGSARYDSTGRVIASQPFAPEYRSVGEGDTLVELGGGQAPQAAPPGDWLDGVARAAPDAQVTSGLRTPQRNAAVGGVPNSRHLSGEAVDLVPRPGETMAQLHARVKGLPGTRAINEGDHVHVQRVETQGGARVVAQGAPKSAADKAPPSGYRYTANGDLQAIPGGPGDLKAQAAEAKLEATREAKARAQQDRIGKATTMVAAIDQAISKVGFGESGIVGARMAGIEGTKAYDLARDIDTIKSNLGFAELAAMRAASPTGGALGAISDREITYLQSTVASLDIGQSQAQLKANLNKVKTHYQKWLETVNRAEAGPQGSANASARPAQKPAGPDPRRMSNADLKKALGL